MCAAVSEWTALHALCSMDYESMWVCLLLSDHAHACLSIIDAKIPQVPVVAAPLRKPAYTFTIFLEALEESNQKAPSALNIR